MQVSTAFGQICAKFVPTSNGDNAGFSSFLSKSLPWWLGVAFAKQIAKQLLHGAFAVPVQHEQFWKAPPVEPATDRLTERAGCLVVWHLRRVRH